MREDALKGIAERLLKGGLPPAYIFGAVRELEEHREDVITEGIEAGLSKEEAAAQAARRMGDPNTLAEAFVSRMQRSTWLGRHPVVSFCLLPFVSVMAWWGAFMLIAGWSSGVLTWRAESKLPPPNWPVLRELVEWCPIVAAGVLPALFCWMARRSFRGIKWGFAASALLSLHSGLQVARFNPPEAGARTGEFMLGYRLPPALFESAPGFALPLLVFGLFVLLQIKQAKGTVMKCLVYTVIALPLLLTGCTTRKEAHTRGWLGGELVRAEPASWKTPSHSKHVIGAFPAKLQPQYESGLVVINAAENSPLAKAGLAESDLIVALDGTPVGKVRTFAKAIDAATPGTPVKLTVYRNGELAERTATIGRETYRHVGTFLFGLGLSPRLEFDLLPNPDFSLVALGYKRDHERVQLDSAEQNYMRSTKGEKDKGVSSPEGWRAWVGPLSLSDRKRIVSQETVAAHP